MASAPEIKASYFQASIDAISLLGPRRVEVEARLAREIEATRMASRADWLPMAWDQKLSAAIASVGGDDAVIACNKASFLAATEGTFLRPFTQAAGRLFGVSPRGMLKHANAAWTAGSRHAGHMVVTFTAEGATVELVGMHAEPVWYVGVVGILEGVLALTSHDGSAEMRSATDGHPVYDVRWQPRTP
jgi:hypothetical protein